MYLEGQKYLNNSEGWRLSSLLSQSSDRRGEGGDDGVYSAVHRLGFI